MTFDHMWATVASNIDVFTWLGRLAFPIFAFMIVEGFFHTSNLKKYMLRLLNFALISEIPFDLLYIGSPIYPFHQNVLWSFLIGLASIYAIDKLRKKVYKKAEKKSIPSIIITSLGCIGIIILGYIVGMVSMVDYYGYGILTMFVFYFFHGNGLINKLGQLVGLFIINFELMGGLTVPITIGEYIINLKQQSVAILSLIPIWLYNGERGLYNKHIQYFFYAYYPAHMIILYFLNQII